MTRNTFRFLAYGSCIVASLAMFAYACGPEITFRAYLERNFWQPGLHFVKDLAKGLPAERGAYTPYAGIGDGGSASMQQLRDAYQAMFEDMEEVYGMRTFVFPPATIEKVRAVLASTIPADSREADELELLRCKIELRASKPGDDAGLSATQNCFESYLQRDGDPALRSEARGWLARTYYLRKDFPAAAKIYLDELNAPDSNIRRERILNSLGALYLYGEGIADLDQQLDQYFDTTPHALYISNVITNRENPRLNQLLISRLEQHEDLFRQGAESDALAILLMRAALRDGDSAAVLRYANRTPPGSTIREDGEYMWLVGTAHYLNGSYQDAERSLVPILTSDRADATLKFKTANALTGIYERLGQPVSQLRAAFQAGPSVMPFNFNVPYLLDVQLTDEELQQYLEQYGAVRDIVQLYPQERSSAELVRYALAVRRARHEQYDEAARLFEGLKAEQRAVNMREAARLLTASRDTRLSRDQHLQALFDYADFLAHHNTLIFFNDSIWIGFQTHYLVPNSSRFPVAPELADQLVERERKLRDDQEEYWRAYKILDEIVRESGPTPLGVQAATLAVNCLRRIRTDRFGRTDEIQAADTRISNWLLANRG